MSTVQRDDVARLVSSTVLVAAGQVIWSSSRLVERVVVARALDPAAYGEVSAALAVLTFGSTAAVLGLDQGVARYVSRFDDPADARGTWLVGLVVAGGLGAVVAAVLAARADAVADLLFEGSAARRLVVLFAAVVPLSATLRVGVGAIRGHENTIYRTYARDLLYPGVRLGALVAFLWAGAGVLAAGYAYLLGAAAAAVAAHVLLARIQPLRGAVRARPRELLSFSLPLVLAALLSVLLTRTDTLMLAYFKDSTAVGVYNAAYPLAGATLLVLTAFGFMYLPLASRLDADGERGQVNTVYKLTTKWILVVSFPAFLTLVAFPRDVLGAVWGAEYAAAAPALSVLALGFSVNAGLGRNRETLSALGLTGYVLATNAVAFAANVALNVALVPPYGPLGAAVASALSFGALNVGNYAVLRLRAGVSPVSGPSLRALAALLAVPTPAALLLSRHVSLSVTTLPVFLVGTGLVSLAVVGVAGGFQPADAVVLELVESRLGIRVPVVRRWIPDGEGALGGDLGGEGE